MKVLVLAPPMGATGGVQTYTRALVRSLEQILGKENVCLLAVPAEPRVNSDGEFSLAAGVKFRFVSASLWKAIRWRPQLAICAHLGVAPVGRIIHQMTGAPYWLILHGIEVWGDIGTTKLRALQGAEKFISLTKFTFNAASSRHCLSSAKSSILPPFIKVDEEQNSGSRAASGVDSGAPIALTVARLVASERYKGHDVMLDAWPAVLKRVPNAVYWIVGDGDDRARLEGRVQELKVTDSVRFAGAISGDELRGWYHRCQVFAMPARTEMDPRAPRGEGFGIVYLEAMAHGKPVIGPRDGAPGEFIRSGEHGLLVNPVDRTEVENALVELLQNKGRAESLGRAARAWVIQEFSEERFRQRLADILKIDSGIREKAR
jgi:glycosyltransferase involved in cell wall biosynthesis